MALVLMWTFSFLKTTEFLINQSFELFKPHEQQSKKQEREQKEIRKLIKNTSKLNVHVCKITIIFNKTFYKYLILYQ
jgi:hypothetical protein